MATQLPVTERIDIELDALEAALGDLPDSRPTLAQLGMQVPRFSRPVQLAAT